MQGGPGHANQQTKDSQNLNGQIDLYHEIIQTWGKTHCI